jgi:hypothetical protein
VTNWTDTNYAMRTQSTFSQAEQIVSFISPEPQTFLTFKKRVN